MSDFAVHDDPVLLAAAGGGDARAFRRLVEPYRRELEVHCYRMSGSVQDGEDLTQETLLRAWKAFESFEQRSSVRTWLYRIATNACLDEARRRPRRLVQVVDPYPDDVLDTVAAPADTDPAARYAQHEGMQLAFLTTIQRLPARQRAVLILRDVLGWSASETAALLDMSVPAANGALQRARETLAGERPARVATPPPGAHRDLLERYVGAWERADIDGLVSLLQQDAVLSMPPQPTIVGASAIVEFFVGTGVGPGVTAITPTTANGRPAFLLEEQRANGAVVPHRLLVVDVGDDGRAATIHAHRDPAVLRAFAR